MKKSILNTMAIILVFLGILAISGNFFLQIQKEQKSLVILKKSIEVIKNTSNAIFHLQKERGYMNMHICGDENIIEKIKHEQKEVDFYLNNIEKAFVDDSCCTNIEKIKYSIENIRKENFQKKSNIDIFVEYTNIINELLRFYYYPLKEDSFPETAKTLLSIYLIEENKEFIGEFRGIFSALIVDKRPPSERELYIVNKSYYGLTEIINFMEFPFREETLKKLKNIKNMDQYKDLENYYKSLFNLTYYHLNAGEVFYNLSELISYTQEIINIEIKELESNVASILKEKQKMIVLDAGFILFNIILLTFIVYNYMALNKVKENLDYTATHDSLTKLPNRKFFFDNAEKMLELGKRNNLKYAVLFMDLDNFKSVNDNFGHDKGDELLIDFANILKAHMRKSDLIARFGGDEFVVLMQYKEIEDITLVIKRIQESTKREYKIKNKSFIVTTSIGVSLFPEHSQKIEELLKLADMAMYKAKKQKNTYVIYEMEEK
ncbi:GGDEF domain-containing protein [Marinitoga sp. 1135]|uniref:GGDEF domain-containing protein n=1 Tax=Marinitoga sp. 1135 TaxID=1643333 RepID=UPI0015863136|nr:GGDEF domain-containing protein [Marinitoga sp. 1135]